MTYNPSEVTSDPDSGCLEPRANDAISAEDWEAHYRDRDGDVGSQGNPLGNCPTAQDEDPLANRVLDLEVELAKPPERLPWRVEGIAADGYMTIIAGRAGDGKSWVAQKLAEGVNHGQAVAGIKCVPGHAIYFDAENGKAQIVRRLRSSGVTAGNARLAPTFYDCGGLDFKKAAAKFEAAIRFRDASLAVFDSLRTFSPGAKENESDDMAPLVRRFVEIARKTSCAVVLIHHRPKADDGPAYRGSSAIEDQADLLFALGRSANDPERRTRRFLETVKCRIDEEPETRWLKIHADRGAGTVSLSEAEPFEGEGRPAPIREERGRKLDQALEVGTFESRAEWIRTAGGDPQNGTWKKAADERLEDRRAMWVDDRISKPTAPETFLRDRAGQSGQGTRGVPRVPTSQNGHNVVSLDERLAKGRGS
jgi:hypothetical protein